MESNSSEKKPKRPRIGQTTFRTPEDGESRPRYERPSYNNPSDKAEGGENEGYHAKRPYQQRPYQQRPYQQRQGGYNNGYNRPYQPRPQRQDFNSTPAAEGETAEGENTNATPNTNNTYNRPYQQRPYQQRQGGYNNGQHYQRQGGYNNGPRQGGYNNNQRQGSYSNGPRQGGYNNNQRQGGYSNGPRQGGYNNNQRQGAYNNGPRQNGYNKRNNQNGFPGRGKSFTPRPKRIEYEVPVPDPNEQIRLNKYMSNAGICSRREADEFIQQGLVKVNGQVVTELGTKISCTDVVEYAEKVVTPESKCYILLNKPKDCVTTSDDPNGRLTVMDLVKGACPERIYPVGRLDRNTTGVLLLTNDGDLASKLTHPKFVKKKIYHVWCDRDISEDDMQRIADGIELDDGPIHADAISYATETDRNQAGIEIHSGRNRIVRRIFESLGYHVTKLDRVYFAGLTKKNLPRGRWRYLTQEEVNYLKMGSFE